MRDAHAASTPLGMVGTPTRWRRRPCRLDRRRGTRCGSGRWRSAQRGGERAAGDRLAQRWAPRRGSPPAALRPPRAASIRAAASSRAGPACRDAAAGRTARSTVASSTLRPAYITTTRCAISATTPRSCVISMIAVPSRVLQVAHQVEDLRLDGHVERRGRLVGDQQLRVAGQRHRDHHPLAHAAGELVRILAHPPLRRRGCPPGAASRRPAPRACARVQALVQPQRLGDLLADRSAPG